LAFADTGADVSMISTKFAKVLGYHDGPGGQPYNGREPIQIALANNDIVSALGAVDIVVSVIEPPKSNSSNNLSVARLVDTDAKESAVQGNTCLKPISAVIVNFHVFENPGEDLLLSETILSAFDTYKKHADKFGPSIASNDSTEPVISIAGLRKPREGTRRHYAPLSEEQKFRNTFSAEGDRLEETKTDIKHRLLQGVISQDQGQALIDAAEAGLQDWARRNRQLLDRYFPGEYDKIIPQLNLVRAIISAPQVAWVYDSEVPESNYTQRKCRGCVEL
jgi:hypothetical protein